ncbi:MAG: serine hydrolase domain-containing protein [Flavobacteriaceae bacterium]
MGRNILIGFVLPLLGISTVIGQTVKKPDNLYTFSRHDRKMDSLRLYQRVDSIITNGIKESAFPGAQILVAHKGQVFFHKSYGFHTYDSIQPVTNTDLYDLASITKITAPLPALMKLIGEGVLDLDKPFSTYWRSWRGQKDKKDITLREILAHQAGLAPYIVFLNDVLNNGKLKRRFVRPEKKGRFTKKAYQNLYVRDNFDKRMYRRIAKSETGEKKYRYSGQAFLIFPKLIEQLTGRDFQEYLQTEFYGPMGCSTMGFVPSVRNLPNNIVPTEMDTLFRNDLVQGWVHDENAALLGGVSGNAGLFATAEDLFKMMQLYLNKGAFNGKQYLRPETVVAFTSIQFPENGNRRGLGFDKPLLGNDTLSLKMAYPAPEASPQSFGHSGFTGTFAWADPQSDFVYIFLSNRVYPSRTHRKLYELNIRTAVQQLFYEALFKGL